MFPIRSLVNNFIVVLVLAVPLMGCSRYAAHPISTGAQPPPTRVVSVSERTHGNSEPGSAYNEPLRLPLLKPRIEVWKAERKLLLFSDERVVRTYHIGLGLSPVGDKERAGDHRTPEGDFFIFIKNPKSAFYLSLGISYPNLAHARRGLRDGLITQAQYGQIADAIKRKKGPPQNTTLGGLIYIHGNGSRTDWTWGCVALENADVKELFDAVEVGIPVTIKP